jgi:hypothetical protein
LLIRKRVNRSFMHFSFIQVNIVNFSLKKRIKNNFQASLNYHGRDQEVYRIPDRP